MKNAQSFTQKDLSRTIRSAFSDEEQGGVREAVSAFKPGEKVGRKLEAINQLSASSRFAILHGDVMISGNQTARNGSRLRQQLNSVTDTESDRDSTTLLEYFAQAAGNIPEDHANGLDYIPQRKDREELVRQLRLITDPTSKGEAVSQQRAEQLADAMLANMHGQSRDVYPHHHDVDLSRLVFNTRLALTLQQRGVGDEFLTTYMAMPLDMQRVDSRAHAGRVLEYPQTVAMRDVDTASDLLALTAPEEGQALAVDFLKTYKNIPTLRRSMWKVTEHEQLGQEASAGGSQRSRRAMVEVLMRAIGITHESELKQTHFDDLEQLCSDLGLISDERRPGGPPPMNVGDILNGLLQARGRFRPFLYLDQSMKRSSIV